MFSDLFNPKNHTKVYYNRTVATLRDEETEILGRIPEVPLHKDKKAAKWLASDQGKLVISAMVGGVLSMFDREMCDNGPQGHDKRTAAKSIAAIISQNKNTKGEVAEDLAVLTTLLQRTGRMVEPFYAEKVGEETYYADHALFSYLAAKQLASYYHVPEKVMGGIWKKNLNSFWSILSHQNLFLVFLKTYLKIIGTANIKGVKKKQLLPK